MKKLLFLGLVLTTTSSFASDYTLDAKNLVSYRSIISDRSDMVVFPECYSYDIEIVVNNNFQETTLKTEKRSSGCDGKILPDILTRLNRIKMGRISMYKSGKDIVCYKTVGIFNDAQTIEFDYEITKCP